MYLSTVEIQKDTNYVTLKDTHTESDFRAEARLQSILKH